VELRQVLMFSGGLGGGDVHGVKVAPYLSEQGYEVHLLVHSVMYRRETNTLRNHPNLHLYLINSPTTDPIGYFIYVIKTLVLSISGICRRVDVVYSPSHQLELLLPAILCKIKNPGSKMCVVVHHLIPPLKTRSTYKGGGFFERIFDLTSVVSQDIAILLLKKWAEIVLTPTFYVKRVLAEKGFCQKRIVRVGNGVDLKLIDSIPARDQFYDGVTIGLSPSKGMFDLLKVWKEVCGEAKDAKLAILASFSRWRKQALELISRLKLTNNVDLIRHVSELDKIKILKSSKIYISPCYEVGWSIPMSEAAACGLPIIAYDNQVFREIYGDNIMYVPRGDLLRLKESILFMLSNPEIREEYSRRSRSWAIRNEWKKVAKIEGEAFALIGLR